jgi:hypothetical protein
MRAPTIGCLTCRERFARCRGCCYACYRRHRQAIAAGKATWPELEGKGLAAPATVLGHAWRGWRNGK